MWQGCDSVLSSNSGDASLDGRLLPLLNAYICNAERVRPDSFFFLLGFKLCVYSHGVTGWGVICHERYIHTQNRALDLPVGN